MSRWPVVREQIGRARQRLDVDAMPAAVVEELRHRMHDGMAGADVDVEPVGTVCKQPMEQHVFVILCVRHHRHGNPFPGGPTGPA